LASAASLSALAAKSSTSFLSLAFSSSSLSLISTLGSSFFSDVPSAFLPAATFFKPSIFLASASAF